jgi:hypothetical protein
MRASDLTRRDVLLGGSAAGAAFFLARTVGASQGPPPARPALDHVLLGVGDLDCGVDWVEKKTGVKAAAGGSHPGVGTRNALLSLGGARYLEIIAPDPLQQAYNFHIDVRALSEPRLITWAAAADVGAVARSAAEAGLHVFGPRDGSRSRPDGKVLKWRTLGVLNQLGQQGVEPVPFFIEWAADSPHPAQDSPGGCELESFEIEHPDAAAVSGMLSKLGVEVPVKAAATPRLRAALKTPGGLVVLS